MESYLVMCNEYSDDIDSREGRKKEAEKIVNKIKAEIKNHFPKVEVNDDILYIIAGFTISSSKEDIPKIKTHFGSRVYIEEDRVMKIV